jgi:hypothetical protein
MGPPGGETLGAPLGEVHLKGKPWIVLPGRDLWFGCTAEYTWREPPGNDLLEGKFWGTSEWNALEGTTRGNTQHGPTGVIILDGTYRRDPGTDSLEGNPC